MRALIIGGTSNYGLKITNGFKDKGYEIITLSRSPIQKENHFTCDLNNLEQTYNVFQLIKRKYSFLEAVICVAGYANPTKLDLQDSKLFDIHIKRNFSYVELAFSQFRDYLSNSQYPIFSSLGSQWSLKVSCPELLPYISAKHVLRLFIKQKALEHPKLKITNYCLPTSNTSPVQKIKKKLTDIDSNYNLLFSSELADPSIIAKSYLAHLFNPLNESGVYIISKDGHINKF